MAQEKPIVSIAIPTYNRSAFLQNMLGHLIPQAQVLEGKVEICISNNGSRDDTDKVVWRYQQTNSTLIKYNKNEQNQGYDNNLLSAIEMSEGKFVWLFGDDDMIVKDGLQKVVDLVQSYPYSNTGMFILGSKAYFTDQQTGYKTSYFDTVRLDKSKAYEMIVKEVIGFKLIYSFISALVINRQELSKVLKERKEVISKAIGSNYIHMVLFNLMLFQDSQLKIIKYNEQIVESDLPHYKFYIEDRFELYYVSRNRLSNLLLSDPSFPRQYKRIFLAQQSGFARGFIKDMGLMKSFFVFNYFSYWSCIRLFFQKSKMNNAIIFTLFFMLFSITPSFLLRNVYRFFIMVKYQAEWKSTWRSTSAVYSIMSQGARRLIV